MQSPPSSPRIVLGINDNHDAAAALVVDGRLVAAASEERFDRTKGSGRFPWRAMAACLDSASLCPNDVEQIVFGSAITPPFPVRQWARLRDREAVGHGQFSYLLNILILYQSGLARTGALAVERAANARALRRRLDARGWRAPLRLLDHHRCHAESAYRTQGRARCLVLTADGMGDGRCATAYVGGPEGLRLQRSVSGRAALNTFYSRVTEWLGFTPLRHEGKVTGLAALAEPPPALLQHFARHLRFEHGRFSTEAYHRPQHPDDAFYGELRRYRREEIAAAAQATLEGAITAWVQHEMNESGVTDVALAGGLFANVKLNERVANLPRLRSLWVFPNMSDGGLAVGAALAAAKAPLQPLLHVNLGPTAGELSPAFAERLRRVRGVEPVEAAVRALARGGVVARACGRMEFGPRALGSRSLLAPAHDPQLADRLNAALARSDFMPFAPILREEDAPALLLGVEKAADAARFMTLCFDCTPAMRAEAPAAVHRDGTARPQLVSAAHDPALHALLTRYAAQTGRRVLLNTSFNRHEEPIVCSADEAARTFLDAGLDALWLDSGVYEAAPRA